MNRDRLLLHVLLNAITLLAVFAPCHGAGLGDLKSVEPWQSVAPGIWKAVMGDMQGELRYTQFAAAPPKLDALSQLPEPKFPFMPGEITYLVTPDNKVIIRIPTGADETLYGFGLQLDGIKKSRQVMTLNVDHWSKGGGRTHAPVPFYISSKGYGVFFNTARFLKIYNQVGNRKDAPNNPPEVDRNPPRGEPQPGRWQALPPGDAVEAQINGGGLEVIVFSGYSMLDVVCRYNLYSGGGALPPLWGLGFWHRVHARFNADQTCDEVAQFEDRDFPLDVIGLEPGWMTKSYPCTFEWQKKRFPDPGAFAAELLDQGVRLNLWENPYISKHSRIYEAMYPLSGSHMVWLGIVPDYTLPQARQLLTDQHHQDHIRIGISGYKIDEVDGYDHWLWPDHATFPSGVSGEAMRQSYGLLMQNMLYNDLFKKRNVRTYGLVRGSNGAASGYPFVIYSDSYGHGQYITGLSTASLAGILWTPEARSAGSGREWLNRMQTVCFSPMAKLNAWSSGKKPWSYGDVTDSVRAVIKLRMRLLPYLYSAFADYHFKGIPPIRAMILEDGFGELAAQLIEGKLDSETNPYAMGKIIEKTDQFMFGPSIMVAPFYERQAVTRQVQLPAGNWYDFYTGAFVGNNETITVTAKDLGDRIPLLVKDGAVIPMLTQAVNQTDKAYGHPLEVRFYGKTDGRFTLYEDDGKTFNYEKGQYRTRQLTVRKDSTGRFDLTEETTKGTGPALFGPVEELNVMTQ
jgi:alpha-glucosidase (family GH31 glycosyl hydrolase)